MREHALHDIGFLHDGNWLRLRTLVLLRWWACAGQVAALLIARYVFQLQMPYDACFLVIGAAVVTNLVAVLVYPQTRRLTERETLLIVVFDLLQLAVLLYLTGGLNNPFSILIVGPVTVSAATLRSRSALWVGATAIVIVTLLIWFHFPLRNRMGDILDVADIFRFGHWVAIVIAIAFLGVYSYRMITEMMTMSQALQATQLALAREQKLTDLGGIVAAAAHEMGTPLATIKLASSELADEIGDEDLRRDALLIREQADRCRDILRSMGQAGKEDPHMRNVPLSRVVEEAAEPHVDRRCTVLFDHRADDGHAGGQPTVRRAPEVIHGLRNLVQNAVDFATETVWVETRWDATRIRVRIMDDGPGYPPHLLGRIGDPFVRKRKAAPDPQRPGYEGMGLGLFIAKTLLERTGAELTFANGSEVLVTHPVRRARTGAFVEVLWPRAALEAARAGQAPEDGA